MQTKIWFFLALLITSVTVSAQTSFQRTVASKTTLPEKEISFNLTVVPDKETTSFVIYVSNPEQKRIKLEISHQVYGLATDTVITGEKYSGKYNFEQADDGRYTVTL